MLVYFLIGSLRLSISTSTDQRKSFFIMSRKLLPPRGIFVQTEIIFDSSLSPALRDTLIQLKALAWGKEETPAFSVSEFAKLTAKSDRSIYGHLASLRDKGALRWRTSEMGTIIVYDFRPANCETSQNQENCKILQLPVNINDSSSDLINTSSQDDLSSDCKILQKDDSELQDFSIPNIEKIFRRVTGLLMVPAGGREEVYSTIEALLREYGEEKTVDKLRAAWSFWTSKIRKDNGQKYSKLNHAWVSYALVDEDAGQPVQANSDGSLNV